MIIPILLITPQVEASNDSSSYSDLNEKEFYKQLQDDIKILTNIIVGQINDKKRFFIDCEGTCILQNNNLLFLDNELPESNNFVQILNYFTDVKAPIDFEIMKKLFFCVSYT